MKLECEVCCSKMNKYFHALASIQFQQIIPLKWIEAKISESYSFDKQTISKL